MVSNSTNINNKQIPLTSNQCSNSTIPTEPAYGVYISQLVLYMPELVVPIMISFIERCCDWGSYWTKGS